jgi:CheY-like chemotaxis protein
MVPFQEPISFPLVWHGVRNLTYGGIFMAIVLIVEDEATLLVLAESCLQEHGHKTLSATSITEASTLLEGTDQIDLLFTDIGLKDDSEAGLKLAADAVAKRPNIKVL